MSGGRAVSSPHVDFLVEFFVLCLLGLVAALAMALVAHLDTVRNADRRFTDLLMSNRARETMMEPPAGAPRFVYIDIGEETCNKWALHQGTSCTLGLLPFREQVSELIKELAARSKAQSTRPKLVVIDVGLAPAPTALGKDGSDADAHLCERLLDLAKYESVIAVRPIIIKADQIQAYPSILHQDSNIAACSRSARMPNLWFGSPLLLADPDGVIRSVHAWDTFRDWKTDAAERTAGIAWLASALLNGNDPQLLACLFAGSKPEDIASAAERCDNNTVKLGAVSERVASLSHFRADRIAFNLPYVKPGAPNPGSYGYAPSLLDVVEAYDFNSKSPNFVHGAIVIVGSSFPTSGDLHPTPLERDMPGAIVHANGIRSYASGLVKEKHDWVLETSLIGVAAAINAFFYVMGVLLARRWNALAGDFVRIVTSALGIVVAAFIVLIIGFLWAFGELARSGAALGVLTPVAVVVLEGFFNILHELRRIAHYIVRRMGYGLSADEAL